MINTILGIKGEMEARYNQRGYRVPVTIIKAEPNVVLDAKNGRATLGLGAKKKIKKPQSSLVAKVGVAPKFIREVKLEGDIKIGDKINVSIFSPQDAVKVTGTTKGHGFAGGVKRWGFHGGPKTHGQSDRHRAPGSIGQTTTPGRVFRGKKMAGHYGNKKITVTGLEIIEVDEANNLLIVKGAIPGFRNGYVIVEKTGKVKAYTPPPEEKPKEDEEELSPSAEASEDKEESNESKGSKVEKKEDQPAKEKAKE